MQRWFACFYVRRIRPWNIVYFILVHTTRNLTPVISFLENYYLSILQHFQNSLFWVGRHSVSFLWNFLWQAGLTLNGRDFLLRTIEVTFLRIEVNRRVKWCSKVQRHFLLSLKIIRNSLCLLITGIVNLVPVLKGRHVWWSSLRDDKV